jgi:hypothetical protein
MLPCRNNIGSPMFRIRLYIRLNCWIDIKIYLLANLFILLFYHVSVFGLKHCSLFGSNTSLYTSSALPMQ